MPEYTFDLDHPQNGGWCRTILAPDLEAATALVEVGDWRVVRQVPNPVSREKHEPASLFKARDPATIKRPGPITQEEVHSAVFWAIIKAQIALALAVFAVWIVVLLLSEYSN